MLTAKIILPERRELLQETSYAFSQHIQDQKVYRYDETRKIFMESRFLSDIVAGKTALNSAEKRLIYIDFFPTLGQFAKDRERLKILFEQMNKISLERGSLGMISVYPTLLNNESTFAIYDIQPSRGFRQLYKQDKDFYRAYPWMHYGLFFLKHYTNHLLGSRSIPNLMAPSMKTIQAENHFAAIDRKRGAINEGDRRRYYHRTFMRMHWHKEILPVFYLDDEKLRDLEMWQAPKPPLKNFWENELDFFTL
jgi:hypothetical protein